MKLTHIPPVYRLLVIPLLLSGSAFAATPVAITNPGFELPAVEEGVYDQAPTGWDAYNGAGLGETVYAYNPSIVDFVSEAPEGSNVAGIYGLMAGGVEKGISQTLSTTLNQGDVYQLTVKVGYPKNYQVNPGYRVQLLAGNTVIAEDNNSLSPASGQFATSTVNYVYNPAQSGLINEPLQIRLINKGLVNNENEVAFDDVTLLTSLADTTAPTLASANIVDDKSGGSVIPGQLVTYTVTFSEDMDASTVSAASFGNAGTAAFTIGTVTETTLTSGVFTVPVTPSTTGTLILKANAGAVLKDFVGNALDTTSAIPDDTTITVVDPSDNTGTGGTIMYTDSNGLNPVANPPYIGGYVVHTFTNSGTLNIPVPASADVLVVGGGGGGGQTIGGGGGGGGVTSVTGYAVSAGSNYTVTVGAGGAGIAGSGNYGTDGAASGTNSSFGTIIAYGGGGGGSYNQSGTWNSNGASGGGRGAGNPSAASNYTNGQGSAGGTTSANSNGGAGGGGAGAIGSNGDSSTTAGGVGGAGVAFSISGTNTYYSGGGGGGSRNLASYGPGGAGGLGGGGAGSNRVGKAGLANTGGGGGAGGFENSTSYAGSSGGSGIAIVRYPYALLASPPTLVSIVDNKSGGSIVPGQLVTYTVTFNKDMDASTVSASDFGNAGSAVVTIGTVTETSFGVFTVPVTTTGAGTLQLKVNLGAVLNDATGNALDTTSAILDDTSITVVDPPGNTGSGGTITYTDSNGLNPRSSPPYAGGYVVHTFTNSDTLNIPLAASADVLVVGGGGGGGGSQYHGAGGGAGGLIYNSGYTLVANSNYVVTVGIGGAALAGNSTLQGNDGSNSGFGPLLAYGGGGGGNYSAGSVGRAGGSGGGGAGNAGAGTGGTGISGQGRAGGNGYNGWNNFGSGGGGGAGTNGANGTSSAGGNGGDGLYIAAFANWGDPNNPGWFAGGGGGGTYNGGTSGLGGKGGGGNNTATVGTDGRPNTGGGGGGPRSHVSNVSGAGGSGIVIVRYPYTVPPFSIALTSPANNQIFSSTASVSATATFKNGTPPYTVNFYLDGNSTPVSTTTNATSPLTVDLGVLSVASHTLSATVTDSTSTTVSSGTAVPFSVVVDSTAPTPNPMTFAVAPGPAGANSITMTATTATDALSPPVQYWFENANNSAINSGWISSPTWTDTGLTSLTVYSYKVKARDSAPTPNETAFSAVANTMTPGWATTSLYWDGGSAHIAGNGNGASAGGNGTWDTAIRNWDLGTAYPHVAWYNPNNDTAVFGGTAGTVTLGTNITVGGLTFTAPYTLTGGTVTFGAPGTISNSGDVTIASALAGTGPITKSGAGVLRLPGTNTYSGGTIINAGHLVVKDNANLGATGTGVTFNGSAALSFGNHPATGGATIDLGTRPITINNGAVAGLYHNWANGQTTISGNITGNGGIIWGRDPVLSFNGGDGYQRALLLGHGNTFTGPLTVGTGNENIGVWSFFRFNSLGNSANPITLNHGAIPFQFNSTAIANLTLLDRPIVLGGTATIENLNSTYTMTLGAVSTTTAGAKTLVLGAGGAGGFVNGAISNGNGTIGVYKTSSGTWTLSGANTYTLKTTINAGTLSINSIQNVGSSTANALGKPAAGPDSIIDIANGGTLKYIGTGHSSNRVINLISAGGTFTLDASGPSGTFALTSGVANASSSGISTVAFTGTGLGSLSGAIVNGTGSNVAAVTKSGTGTWILSGTNTYTGTTTVNANSGNLIINGSTGASNITVNGGSNLYVNGSTGSGSITINNGATLLGTGIIGGNTTIAAGGKLAFNLNSSPASHDKLELGASRSLTFSGSSQVTVSGFAEIGTYTLLTAPGGISGPVPSLVYPDEWVAGLSIVGNDLVLTVEYSGEFPDPPTLLSIADDKSGGSVDLYTPITYTVTFNEDMNDNTVSSADFSNAGTASVQFGDITETAPGVFTIQVTPNSVGTLQLQINAGASLQSTVGLNLNTTNALLDNNTLTVTVPVYGVLAVTSGDFSTIRDPGGPFSPTSKTYTLNNYGSQSLDWSAAKSVAWLDLSSASGTLAPGASTTVTVTPNSSANDLTIGSYYDTITFANTTAGDGNGLGNTTRGASLTVNGIPVEVILGNLYHTYDGTPKAVSVTTSPQKTYSLTYNGLSGAESVPTDAGSYDVVATVTESGYTGSASGTLLISKASPSINFAALGTVGNDQTSITLTATSTSNLPVTFTSSNSSVATVDGNTVTIIGIGTSTITAFQAGDENHHPADSVEQVLTVIRANPLAVPGGPYTVSITADLSLNGSGSLASGGQTISTYEWDLDDSNDAGGFTANVTGAIPTAINMTVLQSTYGMVVGNNLIRLRVTDSAGKISIQSTTVLLTAPLHWDADSNYANGQNDGGGGWLSSLTQWRNVAAGSNTNWISGKDAVFGNGGTGGAVTLASPTTIGSLTFNSFTGTYTLGTSTETITLNNGITMNSGAGAVTIISPITLGAAQSWTNNDDSLLKIETRAVNNAGFLLTIGGTGNTLVHYPTTFIDISGAGGLSKTGAGTLTLSGRNTYTGVTTINGGILKLGEAGIATNTPLGTTAAGTVVSTGATLDLNGFSLGTAEALTLNGTGIANGGALTNTSATAATYSGLLTLGSASSIVASSGNLVLSNTGTITGSGFGLTLGGTNAASSVASIIGTDAGTLTKNGTGTWSLTAENTYTGATTVNAGTLKLDFSAAGAPTTNIISNSSALVLGGGTLNLTGKASTTNSQAGNGTTTLNPGLSAITLSANATANPLSLNLGAITRNAGSALRITLPTGTPSATNGVLTTSGTAGQILLSNGVAFATIGTTGWAGMDATNTFIAPVTYTAATPTSLSGNASLNTMMGTTTLSSNTTITSLRAAMSRFYTVNINAGLTLTTGGILVGSGVDDGGVFYINGPGSLRGPAGQELVFLNHPLGITRYHPSVIAAPIVDNGSATGFTYSGLVPASGMGELLFLTGTNTYTGTTRILGGTLSIGNGGTTGSLHPSSQIVNDGTLIINRSDNVAQGTIFASTISGSGSLTKSGTGTLTLTGTNTYSGNTTVNAGTLQIGADNALGSSILVLNGGAIEASGASRTITAQVNLTASSSVVGSQDVTFSNTFYQNYVNNTLGGVVLTNNLTAGRKLTINGTVPIKRQWDPSTVGFGGTGDTVINGSITQGDQSSGNLGNLFKSGTGTLTLSGANTYYGLTTVNQGKLFINGSTAASDITVASGATLGGSGTLGGNATIAAGGKLEFNLSTPAGSHNPLDFASGKGLSFSGASELTISISVGAAPGTYVLVSGGNNITGIPPATLRLPSGCNASVSIVGNELRLVITAIGDITPPSLDNITDNLAGDNIILINTVVTYTVSFNEDIDAATLTDPDFSNAGTSSITIGTITETSPGVFNVPVTPTTPGTLRLRIPTTAVIQDISANALITSPAIDDGTTVTVTGIPFTAWSNAGSFNTDTNNDGVPNGLAWLLGASNPSVNARASLPAAVQNSGNIILTFRTLKTSARGTASIKVQYSKDLGVTDLWTNHEVEVPGTTGNYANYNSSGINFVISNPSGDYIDVQATIPASAAAPGTKLFARVKGTTP